MKILRYFSIFVFTTAFATEIVHAQYIDPGAGSYLFQVIIAGLTLFIFFYSQIKEKIKSLLRKKPAVDQENIQ
jgi:hypothetical protein